MLAYEDKIVTIPQNSPLYPKEWQSLLDAPKALYAIGNTALLQTRKLTVVGSRKTPASALKLTTQIAKELSSVFTVVTGTADGGDGAAIEGALSGSGRGICLLAGGFSALPQGNFPLLERVMKKGLVLSPHEYDVSVRAFSYEYRNRLLALLGEGTFVVGAGEKSGALITAKYAEREQKPVFALPYTPGTFAGVGCNGLLKRGGVLTENAEDIFRAFGVESVRKTPVVALSEDEVKLLYVLKELSEAHVSELAEKSGIPLFKARALLSALEVKGVAVSIGGNRYSL